MTNEMSVPEYIELHLKVKRKKLKFQLGELVIPVEAPETRPFVVAGFLPDGSMDDPGADYICKKLSTHGKPQNQTFKNNDLKKYRP